VTKGKTTHRIQIERDGSLLEWVLRDEPFALQPNLRRAYERGFHQRIIDFNRGEGLEVGRVAPATVETVGDAYAHGYADARKQEPPA
jgi:hypothetical protein